MQGGFRIYGESQLDAIKEALVKFQQKSDTKAAALITMTYASGQVCQCPRQGEITVSFKLIFPQFSVLFIYFYDAPTPSDVFEDFLAIPSITGDVTTRSFSDLVNLLSPQAQYNDQRSVVRFRRMIEYRLIRHA